MVHVKPESCKCLKRPSTNLVRDKRCCGEKMTSSLHGWLNDKWFVNSADWIIMRFASSSRTDTDTQQVDRDKTVYPDLYSRLYKTNIFFLRSYHMQTYDKIYVLARNSFIVVWHSKWSGFIEKIVHCYWFILINNLLSNLSVQFPSSIRPVVIKFRI